MNTPSTVASGATSSAFFVNSDGWVIITPASGASCLAQYTLDTPVMIAAATATWVTVGTYSVNAAIRVDEELQPVYFRLTASSGAVSYSVEGELSSADRQAIRSHVKPIVNSPYATYEYDSSGNVIGLEGPTGSSIPIIVNSTFVLLATNYPAASNTGRICRITDMNNALFESNGTRWKAVNCSALIGSLDTETSMSGTTETVMFQKVLPAGVIQNGDRFRVYFTASKSGTAESVTYTLRLGSAGTIADAIIQTFSTLATTQISTGVMQEFKRLSATTIRKLGAGNSATSFASGGSTVAIATPVTVTNMDSTILYISMTMVSTAAVETVTVNDFTLELLTSQS